MRSLILLFTRYGHTFLFIFLQLICILLIVNYNQSQKEIWINSINLFSGKLNKNVQYVQDFTSLRAQNDSLMLVNASLKEQILNFKVYENAALFNEFEKDSSLKEYKLIPSNICAKTVDQRNNYMTLCSGKNIGLREKMGVISDQSIVGITTTCNEAFCKVMLVNNSLSRISGMVKNKNFAGNLSWENTDVRKLTMKAVPRYANVVVGDTIVTSGYSTLFPYGIHIGEISAIEELSGQDEYLIEVTMFDDMASLQSVYVVDYTLDTVKLEIIQEEIDE